MISVGIDVSKGKSTVCILKPYGEIVSSPFEVTHTEKDLKELATMLLRFDEEVRIVMESTGNYHLPILTYFLEQNLFVSVINSYLMHKYANTVLRKAKTDKLDSIKIANYGIDNWYHLVKYQPREETYMQLQLLSRQYSHYIEMRIKGKLSLINILDRTMPGIQKLVDTGNYYDITKDKLNDFTEEYWHFDNITNKSESEFVEEYLSWARKKGYHASKTKAEAIYDLAKNSIPTLDSKQPTTKIIVIESVRVLKEINKTLKIILSQMEELAKSLEEYCVVRAMDGVGDRLAARLIGEIGDIRRFHSARALIAFAGIDAPPYQSGQYNGMNRRISKRGSPILRKTGYEVMKSLKTHKPEGAPVYMYILKKKVKESLKKSLK